jgi:hypothetical protein
MNHQNQVGNSTGNIMNGGFATIFGKWIFYINANDGNKIYRIPLDGTKGERIGEDYARCLNIVDDWIYYFYYKRDKDEILEYSIKKMRLDGLDCQKACTAGSDNYFLDDGWIYYTDYFDEQKMYRVKIDGSESERIVGDNIGTLFCVVWNQIYYRTNTEFCQMKFDGSERVVLDWIESWSFVVEDDWIYYNNLRDFSSLYKIKTDGSMEQKLCDHEAESMNVNGDFIYYIRTDDEKNNLYRVSLNGKEIQQLNEDDSFGHCIAGDWIYYLIKTEDFSMYRIRIDGTEREKVQ